MQPKVTIVLLLPIALQILGLTFAVIIDPYMGKKRRQIMLVVVALNASLVVIDYLAMLLKTQWNEPMLRTLVDIYGYSVRPIIPLLFACIVAPNQTKKKMWFLIAFNFLVHLTAIAFPVCFTITEENQFVRGPLGYTCHIVSGVLLFYLVRLTFQAFSRKKGESWIPMFNALLIIASVIADSIGSFEEFPITFLTIAIIISNLFYYIWLHQQFVREHERALQAEQRIQIMMTQIQPHFLFNALNTIRALYAKDPPLADRTLENFSTYLRQNLESLSQTDLVPVTKELEHTRLYTEIEVLRFPNVRVEYHIEDQAFFIPALTVQPLVENAIRHGVRNRKDGLVTVSAVREAGFHRVTVEDNGVGFDPKQPAGPEGSHVGLENVRQRVELMCGGMLLLKSEIGKGTSVTLLIPEEKEVRTE